MRKQEPIFLSRPPLLFKLIKWAPRQGLRGSVRFRNAVMRSGYLRRKIAPMPVGGGISVFVPLYRPEAWDEQDLMSYEQEFMRLLVASSETAFEGGEITLIDVGADIGLISAILAHRLPNISAIYAFEPSEEALPALRRTLASTSKDHHILAAGAADFDGLGELVSPDYDPSHHAKFLRKSPSGFPVRTIDSLALRPSNLLMKIDVEGGESAVIRGSLATIRAASNVIVTIEAHPKVFSRTSIDPVRILRDLTAVRPFRFQVAEADAGTVALDKPFFEQFPFGTTIYNIICVSTG